jgi:class II lanthipeptide synthase
MTESNTPFLNAAESIGLRLCRDAIWDGPRCNWLGDSMEFTNHAWSVVHRSFGPELYSGTSGIALFLARLHKATGEPAFRIAAEGAMRQALSRLDDVSPAARIGFYSGLTGIAYALIAVGEAIDSEAMIEEAFRIIRIVGEDDAAGQGLDVVSGGAGAIPVLLAINRKRSLDLLTDIALRHGEHLLNTAHKSNHGWSWDTLGVPGQRDLTGFSHGAAGIGWALMELSAVTGEEKFRDAAEQAFQYERAWFSPEHENWPDFRSQTDPAAVQNSPSYMIAWCHGAPGIGLSRMRCYELTGDAAYLQEAEAAIRTTAGALRQPMYGGQGNYSLCHGMFGNAELLLYAAVTLKRPELSLLAEQTGKMGIDNHQSPRLPWPCGVPGGGETPGLMLGTSGIGYFYLRLFDPERFPSVVMIAPEN